MSSKHKLGAIFPRPSLDAIAEASIKTDALRPAVRGFVENVGRVDGLLMMPFTITLETQLSARAFAEAEFEINRRLDPIKDTFGQPSVSPDLRNRGHSRYQELMELISGMSPEDEVRLIAIMCPSLEWQLAAADGSPIVPWLSSAIIGAWTAVETLTGDLWEAAVNAHPHGLAKLKGELPKGKGQPEGRGPPPALVNATPQGKPSEEKSIRLAALEEYDFNVSSVMGTLLRDGRYDFQNLKDIKKAYWQAFHEDQGEVLDAILHPCLHNLSQVRHLLVHKGGVVDPKFLDCAKGVKLFDAAELGKPLPLDGELVRDLVNPAVETTMSLIRTVDDWLQTHSGGKS